MQGRHKKFIWFCCFVGMAVTVLLYIVATHDGLHTDVASPNATMDQYTQQQQQRRHYPQRVRVGPPTTDKLTDHTTVNAPGCVFLLYEWLQSNGPREAKLRGLETLKEWQRAGWSKDNITLIDNSPGRDTAFDLDFAELVGDIVTPPVRLVFGQLQNYMYEIAAARGLKWYFWGRSFVHAALDFVREVTKSDPERWGIQCIQSGLFCALNVRNVREIKWETLLTTSALSLCDYSARVRLAGFTAKLLLDGSGLLDPIDRTAMIVEHFDNVYEHSSGVKPVHAVARVADQENTGRSFMATAAEKYYTRKWGSFQCDLKGRIPAWSTPHREITVRQVQARWGVQSMSRVQTALRQKVSSLADHIVNAPGCLFLLYEWSPKVALQTLKSWRRAGWSKDNITVIDNSPGRDTAFDLDFEELVGDIATPPVRLMFSQLQNYMYEIVAARGLKWYLWGHVDAVQLSQETGPSLASSILTDLQTLESSDNWGVRFYNYDRLAAFNVRNLRNITWDIYVAQYGSDCDFYHRVRSAGLSADSPLAGQVQGSILHPVRSVVKNGISDDPKVALEQFTHSTAGVAHQYEASLSPQETLSRETQQDSGWAYYFSKYRTRECDMRTTTKPAWPTI